MYGGGEWPKMDETVFYLKGRINLAFFPYKFESKSRFSAFPGFLMTPLSPRFLGTRPQSVRFRGMPV